MTTRFNSSLKIKAIAAVICSFAVISSASAQSSLMADPSVEDLVSALGVDMSTSKAFRPTALPNSQTNQCPGAAGYREVRQADGTVTRNLQVVPYSGAGAPNVDLAVFFDSGSDRLTVADRKLLDNLGRALNDPRLLKLTFAIAGHTDATGDNRVNLSLSCARAISARNYLLQKGIDGARITAYGFGSARPLDASRRDAAVNRRVEVRRAF
jgi:outer membrane protein OmpA-like peptidoglycan-associated protein